MTRGPADRLSPRQRRRAIGLSYVNGALWAAGNGLTSGSLLSFLAQDFGARGLQLSLLLALPSAVGIVRLAAPALIRWRGSAKRASLDAFATSYLLLALLPGLVMATGGATSSAIATGAIALLCAHQLIEFLGAVALWSWFAELVPAPVRGRFFARRNIVQLLVLIPVLLAGGWFIDSWRATWPSSLMAAYAIATGLGVTFLVASLVPLYLMPGTELQRAATPAARRLGTWRSVLGQRSLWWLVTFGCWLSFFNGLTQVAQNVYPKAVLGMGLAALAFWQVVMRLGQIGVSQWVGRFSDRFGSRPALIMAQLLVAMGPLCYFMARPGAPSAESWIGAAFVLWSGYAVLNVCLTPLLIKLAPMGNPAPAIAIYFAASSLAHAAGTVLGGAWFDWMKVHLAQGVWLAGLSLDRFDIQFLIGWLTRSAAVVWLVLLPEPGAWRWRDILRHRRATSRDVTTEQSLAAGG